MPHVIVKLWPGQTEKQKLEMTDKIVRAVTSSLHYGNDSVSVALEEIEADDWKEKVYKPDILDKQEFLYKKPGYKM